MGTKSIFASKTFWGAIIMAASPMLGIFGVELSDGERTVLTDGLTVIGTAIGAVLTIVGRIKAKQPIK